MRWNQYWYEAHLEATRRYVAKRDGDAAKNKATYNEIIKNLQDHPTARDVENGDALNAALDQLSDPRISSSSLKIATAPIDAKVIKDIPFRNASEAVTIVLSQVKAAHKWPAALNGDRFVDEKKLFEEIAEKARKEDEEGEISADTLKKAHDLVNSLQSEARSNQPLDSVKEQSGSVPVRQDLGRPGSDAREARHQAALDQLRMVKTTTLGNLIAFMHVYNLRFGAATTPHQKFIYDQLYPAARRRARPDHRKNRSQGRYGNRSAQCRSRERLLQQAGGRSLQGKDKKNAQPPNPNNRDVADRRSPTSGDYIDGWRFRTFGLGTASFLLLPLVSLPR